jgi:hypothetical protein
MTSTNDKICDQAKQAPGNSVTSETPKANKVGYNNLFASLLQTTTL